MHGEKDGADWLVRRFAPLFEGADAPVLDVAAGEGRNGLHLARLGVKVVCCDVSADALAHAESAAREEGLPLTTWRVDLESGKCPLDEGEWGGMLVFRYLHRPLVPCLKAALRPGALLLYETFTIQQRELGKPSNPDFLLRPGELRELFEDFDILHYEEGRFSNPDRHAARLAARKPSVS
ncbi:methyltransferase domain-containing protein [Desulfohalovibrio reitneri]|uniref:methyltransferase domain-containing protein n=1 Tax=Desulfohalovibrio reitneri TaxID=1307759 RepID=UPI0004A731B5|nr:methyltransferase domain-containing protein [Desulfohalovibrio reitneri]